MSPTGSPPPPRSRRCCPLSNPNQRLGEAVDTARLDMGLSKTELASLAKVARSTIAVLINRGQVPGREVTRSRIEAALGWTAGSFDAVLSGAEPTLLSTTEYPLSGARKVLVEQLSQISHEAHAGAAAAETLSKRLKVLGEIAESAAQLAARTR